MPKLLKKYTCAMESEGEEDVEAGEAFIPGVEVALGHGEGVSEVEDAVHVGVGEGFKELLLLFGFCNKILVPFPDLSGPAL